MDSEAEATITKVYYEFMNRKTPINMPRIKPKLIPFGEGYNIYYKYNNFYKYYFKKLDLIAKDYCFRQLSDEGKYKCGCEDSQRMFINDKYCSKPSVSNKYCIFRVTKYNYTSFPCGCVFDKKTQLLNKSCNKPYFPKEP